MNSDTLSEHFTSAELSVDGACSRVLGNARFLCLQILEPIREKFGALKIHSGFRSPAHNEEEGGVNKSYHLYDGDECAADFRPLVPDITLQEIFDWLRFESKLRFDHVILEHNPVSREPRVIHIQAHVEEANRRPRGAYLRSTGDAVDTVQVDCVNA